MDNREGERRDPNNPAQVHVATALPEDRRRFDRRDAVGAAPSPYLRLTASELFSEILNKQYIWPDHEPGTLHYQYCRRDAGRDAAHLFTQIFRNAVKDVARGLRDDLNAMADKLQGEADRLDIVSRSVNCQVEAAALAREAQGTRAIAELIAQTFGVNKRKEDDHPFDHAIRQFDEDGDPVRDPDFDPLRLAFEMRLFDKWEGQAENE